MTLQLKDLPACPEGMNQQVTPWEIPDSQARWLEDFLLHRENEMTRRGPVKPKTGWPTSMTEKGIGLVATDDPSYQWKLACLHGTASTSKMSILNSSYSAVTEIEWATGESVYFDPSKRYKVATSGHLRGGAIIGVQNFQGQKGQTSVAHWGGAAKDTYTTGTVTVAQDSTDVTMTTGTVSSDMVGMFLFAVIDLATGAGKNYIGQVASVNTGTNHLTLVDGALHAVTGRNYKLRSIRPLERRVAKGTVTINKDGSTPKIVNGALTKFKRQMNDGSATDKWVMFRADDMKLIGVVDTIASDIQLTLVSNSLLNCNKDEYVAINVKGDRTLSLADHNDFGWISASYAGRQWYANNPYSNKSQPFSASRVWFSDIFDPEALDHTADGDHILIPSTKPPIRPITAMIGLPSCLAVFKENELYAIYGTDETNFSLKRVDVDDGALSPMVLQTYQDGVIFAGSHGIWFFDGQQCFDLTEDRITDWYEKAMEGARARTYGAWSMLYKDTYFLYSDKATPPTGPDRTDNTTNAENGTVADHLALAIRLDRRAFTTLTNFSFQGSVRSPNEETQGTIYLANKLDDSALTLTGARFCSASDLFYSDGVDTITTDLAVPVANQLGPNAFWESKRYDIGQPELKKRFKQLQMQYRLDSVTGNFIAYGLDDASIGHTTADGSAVDLAADIKAGSKITLTDAATVSTAKIYLDGAGSGSGSQVCKAVLYNDSGGSPGTRIASSAEVTVTDGQAAGWVTFTFASQSLAAGSYWLILHGGTAANTIRLYRTAGSNYVYKGDTYADGASDPFGTPDGSLSFELNGYLLGAVGQADYDNNYLSFATMVGFNELSTTSGGKWRLTRARNSSQVWKAAFQNKRLKFNKRSTHVGFKIQQSNKTGIKTLRIGPSALAYREMRPGRV